MDTRVLELNELWGRLHNIYMGLQKTPRDYGCGHLLYMSEIHMIEMIGNHPDANSKELAHLFGVTKGLVSRITGKLEKRGFINRHHRSGNRKEVFFSLTKLGRQAFRGHEEFTEKMISWTKSRVGDYSERDYTLLRDYLLAEIADLEQLSEMKD